MSDPLPEPILPDGDAAPQGEGFVFATCGDTYDILARRAARTLRRVMPQAQIDWYTDAPVDDPVFDQVHRVRHAWFRPKMEALCRSRFARTVYLDADMVVLQDLSDVFEVLRDYDFCGVHGRSRSPVMAPVTEGVPRAAPVINGGLIGIGSDPRCRELLVEWERIVHETGARYDQPSLRALLYRTELRFYALTLEYNMIDMNMIDVWRGYMGAMRILHVQELHKRPPGDPDQPFELEEFLGLLRAKHVRDLAAVDWSVGGDPTQGLQLPIDWYKQRIRRFSERADALAEQLAETRRRAAAAERRAAKAEAQIARMEQRLAQLQDAAEELRRLTRTRTVRLARQVNRMIGRG